MSMETAVGADGAGYPPKHSTGAAGATTENGVHLCREYDKVASEASVGGQSIAGPSAGEDGHGSTSHSAGHQKEEGGGSLLCLYIVRFLLRDRPPVFFVPPLLLLVSRAM